MSTDRSKKLKQVEVNERGRLEHLLDEVEPYLPGRLILAAAIVVLPLILGLVLDGAGRILAEHYERLPVPGERPAGPGPPLVDHFEEDGWGDLLHLTRLPYYESLMDPERDRGRRLTTDEAGFPNPPAGGQRAPIDGGFEVIVTGASFMALASSIQKHFAAQLADALDARVYNASWWGAGPVRGALYTVSHPAFGKHPDQVLVWGIIQRDLVAGQFDAVFRELTASGEVVPPSRGWLIKDFVKRVRLWNVFLAEYLEATSLPRDWARSVAPILPTVALDRGATSLALQSTLVVDGKNEPVLFFEPTIESAYSSYDARSGDTILEAIRRVSARSRSAGVRLIVLLIPDKYSVFKDHLDPDLEPRGRRESARAGVDTARRATHVMQEKLQRIGIEAIDLYEPFHEAQFGAGATEMLYRLDDTHWTEKGIRVAVRTLADHLEATLDSQTASDGGSSRPPKRPDGGEESRP